MKDDAMFKSQEQQMQYHALAANYGGAEHLAGLAEEIAIKSKPGAVPLSSNLLPLAQFWSQAVVGIRFGLIMPRSPARDSFRKLLENSSSIRNELSSRHFTLLQDFHFKELICESDCLLDSSALDCYWEAFLIYSDSRRSAALNNFARMLGSKDALEKIEHRANLVGDAFITEALKDNSPGEAESEAMLRSLGYRATIGMASYLHLCKEVSEVVLDKQVKHSDWPVLRGNITELFNCWLAPLEDEYTLAKLKGILTTMAKSGVIDSTTLESYITALKSIVGAKEFA